MTQQINLFNPVFLKQRKVFVATAMAQALGVLVLGIVAVVLYGSRSVAALQNEARAGTEQLVRKESRLARVTAQFAPRQASAELAAQVAAAESRLHAMQEVSSVLDGGKSGAGRGFSEYFKALARQGSAGLWLTGVSIAGSGTDIGVRGRALDPALVPGYIRRLTHEPVMNGKSFGSLQITRPEADETQDKRRDRNAAAQYVEFSLGSVPALPAAAAGSVRQ